MAATHNITVPQEYQSGSETKTRWLTIGRVISGEKNGKKFTSVKIDVVPTGWDGWAHVYPIDKEKDGQRSDNRRDETPADQDATNDLQQHPAEDINQDIDQQPIDLSEIPL